MKIGRGAVVQRNLEAIFEGQSAASLGEGQLLRRFAERRDEPAFAALVARHGPMVLGVCRRFLADPHDVEDAFQATFLVLVRRAGSLRDRDRLAPWLFGVARKVAGRARSDRIKRMAREGPGVEEVAVTSNFDDPARELGRALVEEIDRLPGPLREPILLCCVEGLTYAEAADRLGSTPPAIRGRLGRARGQLKSRLARRGFAPAIGGLGALLTARAASASVPLHLLKTTIQVAKAGAVPAGVDILAEGVIRTMILTKSKIFAAALVACGVAGSSVGLNAQDSPAEKPRSTEAERLDQVEKKLDRVLQALEGKPARPPVTYTFTPDRPPTAVTLTPDTPSPTTAAAPVVPPQPPAPAPASSPVVASITLPAHPTPPMPPAQPTSPPEGVDRLTFNRPGQNITIESINGIVTRTVKDADGNVLTVDRTEQSDKPRIATNTKSARAIALPSSARIDALEQKLRSLEFRLDNIERRLGPESKGEVGMDAEPPRATRVYEPRPFESRPYNPDQRPEAPKAKQSGLGP